MELQKLLKIPKKAVWRRIVLTKKIIDLIEANALQLSKEIKRELLLHQSTRSYQKIDEKTLHDWIYDVCSRFSFGLTKTGRKVRSNSTTRMWVKRDSDKVSNFRK